MFKAQVRFAALIAIALAGCLVMTRAHAADPLSGAALYDDVKRYEAFGTHRFGSAGADGAMSWIAAELARAGLEVEAQTFDMDKQYDFQSGVLSIDGSAPIVVAPHWWMPETTAAFSKTARIVSLGDATGAFVRVMLPFDNQAYLAEAHKKALADAFARKPVAVLLTIDHPSGEIFTYNVDQGQTAWPVPVVLVPGKAKAALDAAEAAERPVTVDIRGAYRRGVPGRNIIGRINRGAARTIVVSTPVTSWFTSTCERGPGIAGFLAMARLARERFAGVNFVFVATAGHEIGHGGMERFIASKAPKPNEVAAWVHLGASIACYQWKQDGNQWVVTSETTARLLNRSQALNTLVTKAFSGVKALDRVGEAAAIGELREIHAAGYSHFFGMAGLHPFFHTPADTSATTGPDILEPPMRAFAAALGEIAAQK